MKAILCELCGSNDLIKKDGVFVCQYCGTKYTVEEARKLLLDGPVEVSGTVKVDNQTQIDNYLSLIISSFDNDNYDDVIKYCEKLIELVPDHAKAKEYRCKAWAAKAINIYKSSTINDIRFQEFIDSAKKAVKYASENEKTGIAEYIYLEIKKVFNYLLSCANEMPAISAIPKVHNLMLQWGEMLSEVPDLSEELILIEVDKCRRMCEESKRAFLPSKRILYSAYSGYNKKEPYDVTMRKKFISKRNMII